MLLPRHLKNSCYVFFGLLLVLIAGCTSQTSSKLAQDGLITDTVQNHFDQVLIAPDTTLPAFSRVYLEPSTAYFSSYWLQDNRGKYTHSDLDRLTSQYAGLLDKALRSALEKDGRYQLVDSAQDAEVIFRPRLQNLNIYAPDLSHQGRVDYYIYEAGNATLNLLLVDAETGTTLAQFIDHHETYSNPTMRKERTNRAINARYFSRMMDRWMNNLMTYLDNHKSA
jgi:hypothetical protein